MANDHSNPASLKPETRTNITKIASMLDLVNRGTSKDLAHWTGIDRKAVRYALKYLRRRGIATRCSNSKEWSLTGIVPMDAPAIKTAKSSKASKNKTLPCNVDKGTIKRSDLTDATPVPSNKEVSHCKTTRKVKTFSVKSRASKAKNQKGTKAMHGFSHSLYRIRNWHGPATVNANIVAMVQTSNNPGDVIPCTATEAKAMAYNMVKDGKVARIHWGNRNDDNTFNVVDTQTIHPGTVQPVTDSLLSLIHSMAKDQMADNASKILANMREARAN